MKQQLVYLWGKVMGANRLWSRVHYRIQLNGVAIADDTQ